MQEKRKVRKETNMAENIINKNILIEKRKDIEAKITKKIQENEEEKIIDMTKNLSDKKNNNKELWKIKKRTQTEQSSAFVMKDKEGNTISNPDGIKERVSEYYNELFENNKIKEGYEEYHKEQEEFIQLCWNMNNEHSHELETSEIEDIISNLENEKAVGPDGINNEMIKEAGNSMKNSIIRMMKTIYKKEELPEDWNNAYIKKYI